jgi:2-iminobutanoate/2-iminopropanoate deaminase
MQGYRETVTAAGAPAAIGPYSHAVRVAGELLFCSGQIPLDPASGELVGASAAEQARRCLENLQSVCAAAGTTLARAVRITIYMTDLERFAEVNAVCAELLSDDPPARVTVGVAALPRGASVEIDAVVALGEAWGAGVVGGEVGAVEPERGRAGARKVGSAEAAAAGSQATEAPPGSATGVAPPLPGPPPAPTTPGHVYHLELRHFPRNVCRFNLSAEELHVAVLAPWVADRPFELGELKWDPRQARLTVLEGPRLAPGELTMGRGWSAAQREGRDVTAQLLAATAAARGG